MNVPGRAPERDIDIELTFFRHAESEMNLDPTIVWGRTNHANLTATGRGQAGNLHDFLEERELVPDLAFASPANRTMQSATIALGNKALEIGIIPVPDLQENDEGEWTGRKVWEVKTAAVQAEKHRLGRDFAPPGGESKNQVADRAFNWLVEGLAEFGQVDGRPLQIFAFTHGNLLRCLTSKMRGTKHTGGIVIPKLSMTGLTRYVDGEWSLDFVGRKTVV